MYSTAPSLQSLITSFADYNLSDTATLSLSNVTLSIDIPGYAAGQLIPSAIVDFYDNTLQYDTFSPLSVAAMYNDRDTSAS